MAKYRIKEYEFYKRKGYVLQRKSIFGFWYNPDNIDFEITGWYDTLDEAKEVLRWKLTGVTSKVV